VATHETWPRPLAVARIGFGTLALLKAIDIGERMQKLATSRSRPRRYFDSLPDMLSTDAVPVVVSLWVLAGLAILIGWKARWACLLLLALIAYVLLADLRLHNQHAYLMIALCILFALSRCDAALALDARGKPKVESIPGWPVLLMKIQLGIAYGFAGLAKLNVDFLSGTVVYHTAFSRLLARSLLPGDIRTSFFVNAGVAWFTVVTELLLAFGLWLPRLRPALFTFGAAFHIGMLFLMPAYVFHVIRLFVFGALLLILYPLFLPAPPRGYTLVQEPARRSSKVWAGLFRALDWHGVLRFETPGGAATSGQGRGLVLIDPEGKEYRGSRAVRRVLYLCPLTCFAGLFLVHCSG
jgi:hypothetical protein